MSRPWLLALPGALFGVGLAVSGMTNPAKVVGFLDVTGRWDPSLALVMGGAMAAYFVGRRLALRRGAPVLGGTFPAPSRARPDGRTLIGAGLFGVGWGIAGFCPGPAVTNIATGRADVLAFVAAMVLGMLVAQRGLGADRPAA